MCLVPGERFAVLGTRGEGELVQIRWNNEDRAVMDVGEGRKGKGETERWYAAARKWVEILRREESEYWVKLEPGRPLSEFILSPWFYVFQS